MEINDYIKFLTKTIVNNFSIKKLILFGSYAYGNPDKNSDIDLCVITDLQGKRKKEMPSSIIRKIMPGYLFPMDLLVYNEKEFIERAVLKSTLEYKINRDGVVLYEN